MEVWHAGRKFLDFVDKKERFLEETVGNLDEIRG